MPPHGDPFADQPWLDPRPRWVQLAVLPALLIIGWFVLGAIGQVIFIFLVAGLIAMVLNPLVRGLDHGRVPRYVGVFVAYAGFVAIVVVIAGLVWPPVVQQLRNPTTALPGMADQAGATVERLQRLADGAGLSIDVRRQLQAALTVVADHVPQFTSNVVDIGVTVVRQVTYGIIIVVISIYMLLDAKRIGRFVAGRFPTRSVRDARTTCIARGPRWSTTSRPRSCSRPSWAPASDSRCGC